MSDDPGVTTGNHRQANLKKLGRDVGVNTLANILAAPIIYLLGAATGVFRRIPAALVVSASIITIALMIAAFYLLFLGIRASKLSQKMYKMHFGASLSALAPAVLFIAGGLDALQRSLVGGVISVVLGVLFLVGSIGLMSVAVKSRRSIDPSV